MRTIAIVIIASLFSVQAFAQEAADWRKVAEVIPLGSKVKVQTVDGKRVSGTLMRVDETSIMVKRNTRLPEPGVAIQFSNVGNLERDQAKGFHLGKALAIGAATGAGFILTMFAIAVQLD
jgi:small nuclear ribonucleoprotein (snRNP)-like protein